MKINRWLFRAECYFNIHQAKHCEGHHAAISFNKVAFPCTCIVGPKDEAHSLYGETLNLDSRLIFDRHKKDRCVQLPHCEVA